MDKPGLQRAIPYMIIAFVLSLASVYIVRSIQNMDPIWGEAGAQTGLVLAAFVSGGAFLYGMGAFDPKMSEHGEHAHEEVAPEKEFSLRTDGWFYGMGRVMYEFGWGALQAYKVEVLWQPIQAYGPISTGIANILWFPLFITLRIFGGIVDILMATRTDRFTYRYINTGFFLLNWLVNPIAFAIWFAIQLVVRLVLGIIGTIWITQGIMVMATAWIFQVIRFYLGEIWIVATIGIVLTIVMFAVALFPTGFRIEVSNEPNASFAENGFGDFTIPIQDVLGLVLPKDSLNNIVIPETSQFAVFLGFIIIVFVSLAITASLIALFFYLMNGSVKQAQETALTDEDRTAPLPIREAGAISGWVANVIRAVPNAIGYKK